MRASALPARPASRLWIHLLPPGLLLGVLAMVAVCVAAFELYHSERIYPGVKLWGIDLSGASYEEATALVRMRLVYMEQPALTLRDGDQAWPVRPSELGARLDTPALVEAAYRLGRTGSPLERAQAQIELWRWGRQLSPIVVFDPAVARGYLDRLAVSIDRPAQDAGLRLDGMQVITTPARAGRALEATPVVDGLQAAISRLQPADITLPFRAVQPSVADIEQPSRQLNSLLSGPLTLVEPSGSVTGTWTIAPQDLARMVVLRREGIGDDPRAGDQILVTLDQTQLQAVLEPIVPLVTRPAASGRYVFDDDNAQFIVVSPSVDGQELDVQATLAQINQQAFTDGNRRVPLVLRPVKAKYHDGMTPQELGITQVVAQGVTYFLGSSAARVHNIAVAAAKFHGIIIAPGETFSFNQYLGDVSLEEGYEQGLIIYEGRTVEGVGGGVCQVSTTVLRAAYPAGFPIVERWPHAYRVSWYEKGFGPGLDATVFAPLVDFKFTNDTPYHLLIESYTNATAGTLTFKFYSTPDGRQVTLGKPEVVNVVPHGPDIIEEDPSLPPGTRKQVDWAVDGADVTVRRLVERDGVVLYQDALFTRYLPWQAVFQVGPPLPAEEGVPQP
ncbi:MAG: VanW family protein [Thermoflexales bacterium]|nr:VanW family protein [Thermoflexales bacterium]